MYHYSISKYNPNYRDRKHNYLKNDWTSVYDIGNVFDDGLLEKNDYIKIEDSYVKTIQIIFNFLKLPYIIAENISKGMFAKHRYYTIWKKCKVKYTKDMINMYENLNKKDFSYYKKTYANKYKLKQTKRLRKLLINKKIIYYGDIDPFVRLMLREDIGARLFYSDIIEIFIGYDYEMGIDTNISIDNLAYDITRLNLFMEKFDNQANQIINLSKIYREEKTIP